MTKLEFVFDANDTLLVRRPGARSIICGGSGLAPWANVVMTLAEELGAEIAVVEEPYVLDPDEE